MKIICDTRILLFDALEPERIPPKVSALIEESHEQGELACADISLWEIAMLIDKGRIRVDVETEEFLKIVIAARNIRVFPVTADIAALSQSHCFTHGDPADRIIAATAIHHKRALVTVDRKLQAISELNTIWK